jgi:hypothetical protein
VNLNETPESFEKPSPQLLAQRVNELAQRKAALQALMGTRDAYYFLTRCTKTRDEQVEPGENPYKPFPDWNFFRIVIALIETERVLMIRKSRTVMLSWLISGWAAHYAFTHPATRVVFQSEDEDRAVNDVTYAKILWEQAIPVLQEQWPLKKGSRKPTEDQAYNSFELANGSVLTGIVGNPLKVNSLHPTIYIADEAALMTRWSDAYASARATKCRYLICNSSALLGEYWDFIEPAIPSSWPDYVWKLPGVRAA